MKFNSIKAKMGIYTAVAIIAIEVIATVISYYSQKSDLYTVLEEEIVVIKDNIAQNISIPLYDLNDEAVDNVIKITLKFNTIAAIVVTENDENKIVRSTTFETDSDGKIKIKNFDKSSDESFYKIIKAKIMHNGDSIGVLNLYVTDQEIRDSLGRAFFALILNNLIIVLVILVVLWFALESIVSGPLNKVALMLTDISEGEGDLTARLEIKEENEIGTLSKAFNVFVEKIQVLVTEATSTTVEVNNIAGNVKGLSDETSNDLNKQFAEAKKAAGLVEIVASSSNNIYKLSEGQSNSVLTTDNSVKSLVIQTGILKSNAEQMKTFVDSTKDIISGTIESIGEVSGSIKNNNEGLQTVIDNLTKLNDGISQVSAAIEETTVSISEISENLKTASTLTGETTDLSDKGKVIINNTIGAMHDIDVKVNNIGGVIDRLKTSSNEINQVVKVIEDIADQTNLLALNAAIEAARAGEAGKGFAVVADEIRKLAEKTTKSTNMIDETVKTIQTDTDLAVQSMDEGKNDVSKGVDLVGEAGKALEDIASKVYDVDNLIQTISISSNEQNQAASIISNLVIDMNNASVDSVNEARRQADVSNQLVEMTEEVAASAMSIDINGMTGSVDKVTELVVQNSDSVQEIKTAVEDIEKQSIEIKEDAKIQTEKITLIEDAVEAIITSNLNSLQKAKDLFDSSDILDKSSSDLSKKVSTFKI